MAEKLSKGAEQALKRIFPEGVDLDKDRQYDAEEILDPNKPEDLRRWAHSHNRTDLKGFDTKDAKEPSVTSVQKALRSELYHRHSMGYIEQESEQGDPNRFVDPRYEMGKLLKEHEDDIHDFKSLKEAVIKSWSKDSSLQHLVSTLKDGDIQVLYSTAQVQGYIDKNITPALVLYLMKKFKIEPVRASNIAGKLGMTARAKLYKKALISNVPKLVLSDAVGRAQRQKPVRVRTPKPTKQTWSREEISFLWANRRLAPDKVVRLFNSVFIRTRTPQAIKRKLRGL